MDGSHYQVPAAMPGDKNIFCDVIYLFAQVFIVSVW